MLTWRRTVFWSGLRRACLAHTPFMTFTCHTGTLMQRGFAPKWKRLLLGLYCISACPSFYSCLTTMQVVPP